jgi:hypothetical protein
MNTCDVASQMNGESEMKLKILSLLPKQIVREPIGKSTVRCRLRGVAKLERLTIVRFEIYRLKQNTAGSQRFHPPPPKFQKLHFSSTHFIRIPSK